jgi:GNAT superfamily N-acetyltransferase
VLRRPGLGEASDVEGLSAAADAALGALPTLSEGLIRQMWARPRFSLQADAWIVELRRAVVGYAQVWAEDPAYLSGFALVHPDHTGRGIGGALAALIEGRAAQQAAGDARLFSATIPEDEAAAGLLTDRGYTWARRFWHM